MGFIKNFLGQTNSIYIHTDKQQYYNGELVSGHVTVIITEPVHVDGIYLKVEGREHVEFNTRRTIIVTGADGKTTTKSIMVRVSDTKRSVGRKYCIFAQRSTLDIGHFVFPFTFPLDANHPGTFKLSNPDHSAECFKGDVSYRVKAEIAVPGVFNPNLRHSQDILIYEPLHTQLMSANNYQESNVNFLCCIPKGSVSLSANIDRNAYGPGDIVTLHLVVDNSASLVNLEALTLKLVRKISATAGLSSYLNVRTVAKTKTPGLEAGKKADRKIELVLPHDSEPSTNGHIINCSYDLSVVLKVPWSPDIKINQGVQVYAQQAATFVAHPQYPSDWKPNVHPTADLSKMQFVTY